MVVHFGFLEFVVVESRATSNKILSVPDLRSERRIYRERETGVGGGVSLKILLISWERGDG